MEIDDTLENNAKLKSSTYVFLALFSGIITAISFTFPQLSLLTWISLVPLLVCFFDPNITKKKSFLISFIYSFSFYLILLVWLFKLYPFDWLGLSNLESILILSAGWIAFSLIESIGLSLLGLSTSIMKKLSGFSKVIIPSLMWVIIEWIQGLSEFGFTWGRLAISQYPNIYAIQSVNVFGSLFTSFLIILTNSILAYALYNYLTKENKSNSKKYIFSLVFIHILNLSYGAFVINTKQDGGKEHKVAIVQGNIPSYEKWSMNPQKSFDIYLNETNKAINETKQDGKMDLIVWTESAIPVLLDNPNFNYKFKEIATNNDAHFITGVFETKGEGENSKIFNSMVVINPKGEILGTYSKRHLVPFGEYLPFRSVLEVVFPKLAKINALKHDITSGESTKIVTTSLGKIGGLICYESIFPEIISSSVNDGAELLTLVTNDSWYKDSSAVYQHNGQAVFRAIENDRYMIRGANTGISSVVSPEGRTLAFLEPMKKGYITSKIKFRDTKTIYTKIGDLFVGIAFVLLSILFIMSRKNKKINSYDGSY